MHASPQANPQANPADKQSVVLLEQPHAALSEQFLLGNHFFEMVSAEGGVRILRAHNKLPSGQYDTEHRAVIARHAATPGLQITDFMQSLSVEIHHAVLDLDSRRARTGTPSHDPQQVNRILELVSGGVIRLSPEAIHARDAQLAQENIIINPTGYPFGFREAVDGMTFVTNLRAVFAAGLLEREGHGKNPDVIEKNRFHVPELTASIVKSLGLIDGPTHMPTSYVHAAILRAKAKISTVPAVQALDTAVA